jgi:hypothetical protein
MVENQLIVDRYIVDGSLPLTSKLSTIKPSKKKNSNHTAFAWLLLGVLMVAFSPQPALTVPDWYNASWAYRKNITIDHNKVNGTQTNFPVLINVTDDDMKTKAQDTVIPPLVEIGQSGSTQQAKRI